MSRVDFKSLKRSSTYAAAAELWRVASRFILTPITIAQIGLSGYGTWTLLFNVCAAVGVLNSSASTAYSKLTAEYDRRGDYLGLSAIISTGVFCIGAFVTGVLLVIWLLSEPIFRLINIPPELFHDASVALALLMVVLLARMTLGSGLQILAGLQRMDLQFKLRILGSAIEFLITVPLLLAGYGLIGLAVGHLIGQGSATVLAWRLCFRFCPQLRVGPSQITRDSVHTLATLMGKFQMLTILGAAYRNLLYMAISALGGVTVMALFDLANKLLDLAKTISAAIKAPLMPAFANMHAGNEDKRKLRLYVLSSKAITFVAIICFCPLVVFADSALKLWTGQAYPESVWMIRGLCLGHFMILMTAVGTSSLRGQGLVKQEMIYMLITFISTAVLIVPAFHWFDYKGIVLVVMVSLVAGGIWFTTSAVRFHGIALAGYIGDVIVKPLLVGSVLIACGLMLRPEFSLLVPDLSPRWAAVFELALGGGVLAVVGSVLMWFVTFKSAERRQLLQRLLPGRNQSIGDSDGAKR